MIRPSSGTGQVLGHRIDDAKESVCLRRKVAYVSENKQLYDYMTVEQIIRFTRPFYPDWSLDREKKLLNRPTNSRSSEESNLCPKECGPSWLCCWHLRASRNC